MISATVDRSAFLTICEGLFTDAMEAIVTEFPGTFSGALRIGDAPAKPAAKPRERKAAKVPDDVVARVYAAIKATDGSMRAIVSNAGVTRATALASCNAMVLSGAVTTTGKGRGLKYVVAGAAA